MCDILLHQSLPFLTLNILNINSEGGGGVRVKILGG